MSTDLVEPDDVLLARVRGGGAEAYDLLYARHAARARRVARAVLDDTTEVDDVVSEAFAAVLGALQRGKGPTEGFEGYLVSTVRHEAYRANRRRTKQRPLGDRDDEPAADPFVGREDEEILRAAFGSLPPFARDVLWLTEVEGRSHADIARSVGSTRQAIATRAARARDALGSAYLAGHIDLAFDEPPRTPECIEVERQLVDLVRGNASRRRRRYLERHLDECSRCRVGQDRLAQFNERLRTAPFMAAAAGASKLATIGGSASMLARFVGSVSPVAGGTVAAATLATTAVFAPVIVANGDVALAATEPASSVAQPEGGHADVTGRRSAGPSLAEQIIAAASAGPEHSETSLAAPSATAQPTSPSSAPSSSVVVVPALSVPRVTVPRAALPSLEDPTLSLPAVMVPPLSVPALSVPSLAGVPLSVPALTVPPVTVLPDVAVPAVTVLPPVTIPPVTAPAADVPSLTVPPVGTPLVDTPAITTPAITTPEIVTPAIATPSVTTPEITTPAVSTPGVVPPAVTTPEITTPEITTPVVAAPAVSVSPLLP